MKRTIIKINEEKCTGCGLCVPACAEGALQIIEGKAKVVSKTFSSSTQEKPLANAPRVDSMLSQWPIQLSLVPPNAAFIKNADLIVAADCVGFAYPNFHVDFLKERKLVIACPKLDDASFYQKKLEMMFKEVQPKSVTVVNMEVPCCFGL